MVDCASFNSRFDKIVFFENWTPPFHKENNHRFLDNLRIFGAWLVLFPTWAAWYFAFRDIKKNIKLNRPMRNYVNNVSIFRKIVMTSRTSNQTRAPSREVGRIAGASRHPRLETEPKVLPESDWKPYASALPDNLILSVSRNATNINNAFRQK